MYHGFGPMTLNFDLKAKFLFFLVTNLCPDCIFFVFCCVVLIFGVWVDHVKMICFIPWIMVFSVTNSCHGCYFLSSDVGFWYLLCGWCCVAFHLKWIMTLIFTSRSNSCFFIDKLLSKLFLSFVGFWYLGCRLIT